MCSSFAFAFVVGDFTLQSQLISDNKSQKAKDLHSSAYDITRRGRGLKTAQFCGRTLPIGCVKCGQGGRGRHMCITWPQFVHQVIWVCWAALQLPCYPSTKLDDVHPCALLTNSATLIWTIDSRMYGEFMTNHKRRIEELKDYED